jgi:hypothetical protein
MDYFSLHTSLFVDESRKGVQESELIQGREFVLYTHCCLIRNLVEAKKKQKNVSFSPEVNRDDDIVMCSFRDAFPPPDPCEEYYNDAVAFFKDHSLNLFEYLQSAEYRESLFSKNC